MKKVVVDGYWKNNLGDDLFLSILANRYKNIDFYIIARKENYVPFQDIKNIKLISRADTKVGKIFEYIMFRLGKATNSIVPGSVEHKLYHLAKNNDFFIEIGGSIFIQPKKGMDGRYKLRSMIADTSTKYFIIGSNFGPFYQNYQVNNYNKLLGKLDGVSFRDQYSKELFVDLDNVKYYPDIIFNLDVSDYKKAKDYILISVINSKKKGFGDNYTAWLIENIEEMISNGEKVVLMSFCEREGDLQFAKDIISALPKNMHSSIDIYNHQNIKKSLSVIARAKKIIATRFHAMILGWLFEKPMHVVSYSEKTVNVINDIAPEQKFTNIKKLNKDMEFEYSYFPKNYFDNIQYESQGHFIELDRIIKK